MFGKNILKVFSTFILLSFLPCILVFISCSTKKKNYPLGPDPKSELRKIVSDIKKNASQYPPTVYDFVNHANLILNEWEMNAPQEVKKEIDILSAYTIESAEAAERLAKMGPYARGASKKLSKQLIDNTLIRPGDFFRLFGAKDFSAGKRAMEALIKMNEWAIPSLILFLAEEQEIKDEQAKEYGKSLAQYALHSITGKDFEYSAESWVSWLIETYGN